MNVLEIFSCSGGMAEGFRRAGIPVSLAFDYDPDACDSYEANLGHRPIQIDARDLLRMVECMWRPGSHFGRPNLLVADPPCTPWSRAGKRLGQADERDMLGVTVEIVRHIMPDAFLIANVPGLDDEPNWPVIQRELAKLAAVGYCVRDFARLDAADYGVPQHRVRPFWFGHLDGPCISWPARTHASPEEAARATLPGVVPLRPWATCREALGHLSPEDLGAPVRLRWRGCNSTQHGSVAEKPARVVGTSNLSDGNVLLFPEAAPRRSRTTPGRKPRASLADEPAHVLTTRDASGDGAVLYDRQSWYDQPSSEDAPSRTIRAATRGQQTLVARPNHPPSRHDAPSNTVRGGDGGGPIKCLEWPWDRPSTTVPPRDAVPPPGHHPESGSVLSMPNAVKLSERAAAILQGFPEGWRFCGKTKRARWAQIGMAMPPPLAHAVAGAIARWCDARRSEAAE